MLSWIPLLGPIIQGISSIFNGFFTEKVQLAQTAANKEIQTAQISEQIIKDTNDDIALRIMRDMAVFPVVVWSFLIGWDTVIVHAPWQWLRESSWPIPAYPDSVGYLPYVVLVFLFGNIGLNTWRNK